MTVTVVSIDTPLAQNLSRAWLLKNGFKPLFGGADWIFRVQCTDENDAGVSLTSATAVFWLSDGTTTITRKNSVTSTGASHAQIVFDTDQTTEDTVLKTGKGWMTVYMHAVAAEVTEFTPILLGINPQNFVDCDYELAVKFGGGFPQHPVLAGRIEVYKPRNTFPLT